MFRNTPADDAAPTPDVLVLTDLIPLSVLELDVDPPAVVGWAVYLAYRGIAIQVDDIGRQAIARADARQLLDEQREMREIAAGNTS